MVDTPQSQPSQSSAAGQDLATRPLPHLRDSLMLHDGTPEDDGSPTWMIYDPAANRFFRIGWLEFECLSRFKACRTVGNLVEAVNRETTLHIDVDDVTEIINFLAQGELLVSASPAAADSLAKKKASFKKRALWVRLLHGYLFFMVPLVHPDPFLKKTLPYVRPLMTKGFFVFMMAVLFTGFYLTLSRWDEFLNTFLHFFSWEGVLFYVLTVSCVKIFHELGHAYVARSVGVRVASIGVAFIVMYPVLFTETTAAWKLKERHKRVLIGFGGIIVELYIAACALILWNILPDGSARSICFFVAAVSLVGSLFVNLNPLMRFDGYYLLSDALGVENMQHRGFEIGRNHMRKKLFGLEPPEESGFKPSMERTLLIYAYATWIYRFFLFLGIALLVYHFFFQPLGLFLMIVELLWFIAMPIYKEMQVWWEKRAEILPNRQAHKTGLVLMVLLLIAIVPWQSTVDIPAVVQAKDYGRLHAPFAAQIVSVDVETGQNVKKGDVLIRLESPDLLHRIQLAEDTLSRTEKRRRQESVDSQLIRQGQIRNRQIEEAQATLDGLLAQKQKLLIRASFDGQVVTLASDLHEERWINAQLPLVQIVAFEELVLHGYVREQDIRRLEVGARGKFFVDAGIDKPLRVEVIDINQAESPALARSDLASIYGGPIAVEHQEKSQGQMIPHDAVYQVLLTPADGTKLDVPAYLMRGRARVEGERRSFLGRVLRHAIALVIRESGF